MSFLKVKKRPDLIDYAVVVFEKEIPLIKLLAKSFSLYGSGIGNIYVIVNDEKPDVVFSKIEEEVKPLFGELKGNVKVVKGNDLSGKVLSFGYQAQQSLKLAVSRLVASPFYVCLDAKNHFTAPFSAEDWVSDTGKVRMRRKVTGKAHHGYLKSSMETFNAIDFDVEQPTPPTVTPYVMYTDVAKRVLEWVENKHGVTIFDYLESKEGRKRTEFFLYYAALFTESEDIDTQVSWDAWPSQTLFQRWPAPGTNAVLSTIKKASDDGKMLGIHRRRFSTLTPEEKEELSKLWVSKSLVDCSDEAFSIIDMMAANNEPPASK